MIQKKKAEIEAKLAGGGKQSSEAVNVKEKKPLGVSIGKRW